MAEFGFKSSQLPKLIFPLIGCFPVRALVHLGSTGGAATEKVHLWLRLTSAGRMPQALGDCSGNQEQTSQLGFYHDHNSICRRGIEKAGMGLFAGPLSWQKLGYRRNDGARGGVSVSGTGRSAFHGR